VLWFIVCVAVLNIATGFGLGVYLAGYSVVGDPVRSEDSAVDTTSHLNCDDLELTPGAKADVPVEADVAVDSAAPEVATVDSTGESEASQDSEDSADLTDTSVMADLDAAVSLALGDVTLPESKNAVPSQVQEEVGDSQVEDGLSTFQSQLESFCAELIDLDDQLRANAHESGAELKSRVDSVAASSKRQDEACQEAERSLRTMITSETLDEKRGEAMIAAIEENRQGAAQAAEAFEQLDMDSEPAIQQEIVLNQTANLLDANHSLRDSVSDLISVSQPASGENESDEGLDPLTGIKSRAVLDATLADHWRKDPHHVRTLSFTVFDLDHFAKFNRNHGAAVGNRVLRVLAQLLEGELPDGCHVARFAGQRFAVLAIDRDLKQAVADAERMRQTIETMRLEHGEQDLEIRVSCGVVGATAADTQKTLYARAVETVQEAKRYGRNRSFVHEGEYPTPVVPPNFVLSERHVTL
jgi:diguanylate cyclase (GGDEF)-like protein